MAPGRLLTTMADKAEVDLSELKRSVLTILDPSSTNEERKRAHAVSKAGSISTPSNAGLHYVVFSFHVPAISACH